MTDRLRQLHCSQMSLCNDLGMLVNPLPGVDGDNLLARLREEHRLVGNLRGGGLGDADHRLFAYMEWAGNAAAVLSTQVSGTDVDRLVLTHRYEQLVTRGGVWNGGGNGAERLLNALVSIEVNEWVAAFDQACTALAEQITRWQQTARFVVLDTCVFIEHKKTIEDLDLTRILGALEAPIHVIVPMMVVDELDNSKRHHDGKRRGRAIHALAVIDRVVRNGGVLRERDLAALQVNTGVPVGGRITLEVVSDPPRHVRLTIPDDEIVDRACAVQALAGSPVTIVTFDTGMSLRAREAGLAQIKLDWPPEPETGANAPRQGRAEHRTERHST